MAKKRREKVQRQPTKHQLSRWEKQKRTQRIIFASGIFVIVGVFGLVGFGWYTNNYQPVHQTVLSVNNTKFDMSYLLQLLRLFKQNQQSSSLSATTVDEATKLMQQNTEIIQAAAKLNIVPTDSEIKAELDKQKLPSDTVYKDFVTTNLIYTKMKDDYFGKDIPATQPQRQALAMFLESQSQANDVIARLAKGEDFGTIAASSSLDDNTKSKNGDLGWVLKDLVNQGLNSTVVADAIFSTKVGAASSDPVLDADKAKSVGYWLIQVIDKFDTQVHLEGMLLGSLEEAQNVRAQLTAGGDFTALAKQYSQSGESDLGLRNYTDLTASYKDFASSARPGTLSDPRRDATVNTKGAYWLFKVTAEDNNRQVSDEDLTSLKNIALSNWLKAVEDNPSDVIKNYLDDSKKSWALQYLITHP